MTARNKAARARPSGLEVGCSIGVLTQSLGTRCDQLLSVDVSEKALALARQRSAETSHIQFMHMQIPKEMPNLCFDLVVISEVGYYWERRDLERAASKLAKVHLSGGHLVLVHLTEKVHDYPLTGDEVHEYWIGRSEWRTIHHFRHERYRLDVLERLGDVESSL